jgi:hypothetical protein
MGDVHEGSLRREFRWSKAARDLVRANMNATGTEVSDLVSRLAVESGKPRWACRRFVRRMGIRSRRPYRVWSEQEQQRLLKLIDLHSVNEISKLMRRSDSSIWHMLQRLGANAKMGKDSFTQVHVGRGTPCSPGSGRKVDYPWLAKNARGGNGRREAGRHRGGKVLRILRRAYKGCRRKPADSRASGVRLSFRVPAESRRIVASPREQEGADCISIAVGRGHKREAGRICL